MGFSGMPLHTCQATASLILGPVTTTACLLTTTWVWVPVLAIRWVLPACCHCLDYLISLDTRAAHCLPASALRDACICLHLPGGSAAGACRARSPPAPLWGGLVPPAVAWVTTHPCCLRFCSTCTVPLPLGGWEGCCGTACTAVLPLLCTRASAPPACLDTWGSATASHLRAVVLLHLPAWVLLHLPCRRFLCSRFLTCCCLCCYC